MGESETVVSQSSAAMDYTSGSYNSSGYADNSIGSDAVAYSKDTAVDLTAAAISHDGAYTVSDGSTLVDGSTYIPDPNILMHDAHTNVGNDTSENASVFDNAATQSSQVAEFNFSANGDVVGEGGDVSLAQNGNASDNVGVSVSEHQVPDGSVHSLSVEEDRLWSIVRANSLDFNAWTELIDETEKAVEESIFRIRKVYDTFLAEFPLCYGYWKKYADHEARLGSVDKVVEVYERAVQGVTYSVDIWLHYCIFAIGTYGDPETVRRLFERGLAYVGSDYLSYPLWDRYIEYEYMQQEWSRLSMIYTRILENPNQQLDRYFNSFKELAGSRPLSELRTSAEEEAAISDAGAPVNEGEVHLDAANQSPRPVSAGLTDAEDLQKYIAVREEMYKKAKEFDYKIVGFETAIKRPYFHVRPLNVAELENWHNYLDFVEREGDFNKVVKLYERCLIACANYPDYWMRYVLCMEASGSMDLATNALTRGTQVFVKRQPEIHLFAARFKEKNEDIAGARAAYQLVHAEIAPGLLEAVIKHANMERRQGNMEDAFSLYEHAIAIEKGKEHSQALPMLYAQYSRFLHLVSGNAERARDILVEALEHVQLSKPLLEDLIFLESIQSLPKQIDYLDSLVEKFIIPSSDSIDSASPLEREELSSIFLEFLDLFGDLRSVKKADERHAKLFLHHRSTSELKKRHAEDFLSSDRAKVAKTYSSVPSTGQSAMGAYAGTQNQWAATGYGVQSQGWPQVTQAQGQQWNPAYSQQAAYSAYGAYATSYTNPQVPTSAPASTAYGAYPPPTYPAQAYPQQSYAQPSAAAAASAAVAPVQQAASVPQSYYGTYY